MSCICLARASAIRRANRAGAAMRPRACETRAKQGPGADRERKEAYAGSEQGLYAAGMRIMTKRDISRHMAGVAPPARPGRKRSPGPGHASRPNSSRTSAAITATMASSTARPFSAVARVGRPTVPERL